MSHAMRKAVVTRRFKAMWNKLKHTVRLRGLCAAFKLGVLLEFSRGYTILDGFKRGYLAEPQIWSAWEHTPITALHSVTSQLLTLSHLPTTS
jgi:hypothetical protein